MNMSNPYMVRLRKENLEYIQMHKHEVSGFVRRAVDERVARLQHGHGEDLCLRCPDCGKGWNTHINVNLNCPHCGRQHAGLVNFRTNEEMDRRCPVCKRSMLSWDKNECEKCRQKRERKERKGSPHARG